MIGIRMCLGNFEIITPDDLKTIPDIKIESPRILLPYKQPDTRLIIDFR